MSAAQPKEAPGETQTLAVRPEQVATLQQALEWTKLIASPTRLAILGGVAVRRGTAVTIHEVVRFTGLPAAYIQQELEPLIESGYLRVLEWGSPGAGLPPQPQRLALNRETLQMMTGIVTVLHQLLAQLAPDEPRPPRDERTRVLDTFLRDGRLVQWPTQPRRQQMVAEEIVKAFAPDRQYTEREVDAILKAVYAYDHCTLRRYLVDYKFLERTHGIYTRPVAAG